MKKSSLQKKPKSKIIDPGYIHVYSKSNRLVQRGIYFNRKFKETHAAWDNSLIIMTEYFSRVKASLGSTNLRVLDIGCGNGNYVIDEYRRDIAYACGIDISPEFTSKNICLDEIRYSNLEKIPYRDNSFDVVLSLWVIEHLTNPGAVFKEVQRVLKPNGYFIFATTHRDFALIRIKRLLPGEAINQFINTRIYGRKEKDIFGTVYKANTPDKLTGLLTEAGLADSEITTNYDPSYTSLNNLTFSVSNFLYSVMPRMMSAHIVGMAQKK